MRIFLIAALVAAGAAGLSFFAVSAWSLTSPVELKTAPGDVKRGAYLARLSGCVACHTSKFGAPFAGGTALISKFGTFYVPNITPDTTHGIGNWSLADFAHAVRKGVSPEGHPYYPAFPYEFYASLTDQDIADMWAALKRVPPVAQPSTPHNVPFPFSLRDGLKIWRALFEQPYVNTPQNKGSESWKRGRNIVQGPAHCAACHTPRNLAGGLQSDQGLTGNPNMPDGGKAPAITPEALKARGWTRKGLVTAMKTGILPNGDVFGGTMAEVVKNSTSYLLTTHLEDMAAYLQGADK